MLRRLLWVVLGCCLLGRGLLLAQDGADSVSSRAAVMDFLEESGVRLTQNNRLTILPSGREKFADLFEHIRGARHHVHLEYFNFRNDSISALLFDLLAQRAAEGVEVRALFDAFGNLSNDSPIGARLLDSLRGRGIQIHKFDPINFPWINHALSRDHRKIVVIDGRTGYLGGMNVADYYIEGKPKIGAWRDMHCRIEGQAVQELQRLFIEMWHKTTGQALGGEALFPEGSYSPADTTVLAIVERTPGTEPSLLRRAYVHAIASADSLVRIINPYFVPTRSITRALREALERGVRIEIMTSSRSDIPFTPDAMLHKLRRLAKRGAQVHLYTDGFHHSKVMTVDRSFSTLGSLNLNSRSLRYDYEANVFIFDSLSTARLDSLYDADLPSSVPLDDAYWGRRSLWHKFVGWFANLFTAFL